ncbi:MAG TPA: aminotransferase class V-fold PLP-dependent enzyme [Allosphingosinicella sp.]|uniref:cysteine desulfurase family protein n=1 Tax=Allosphingosinicella sp. TaxID=2823234 RepID=UPI002ED9D101
MSRIYLDPAATTPVLPAAREAMAEALARWHNPSSPHAEGRAAKAALEDARARIVAALGWGGKIVFTSGASEALGIALQRVVAGPRFVSAVEHDAVFRAAPDAVKLPVVSEGLVDLTPVQGQQPLVAVQHANNETGILQPLDSILVAVRNKGGLLLADCAQTAGKLPLPEADMIAISAHKFGGPPGVGALLLRDYGLVGATGGQEQGYRTGTENLPGIIGMAVALETGSAWMDRAVTLRTRLESAILAAGGEVVGASSPRIATIGAYRMPGVPSNAQLIQFDMAGISVSAGSACSSGSLKSSHVLAALGWSEDAAREVVRVSFGPSTTEEEVDRFAAHWTEMAGKRRAA